MLSKTLRRILLLSPRGRTTLQFVHLLDQASVKSNRAEILAALDEMRRQRLIRIDRGGHWHLQTLHGRSQLPDEPRPPAHQDLEMGAPLHAVRTRIRSVPDFAEDDMFEDVADTIGLPPFDRLLSYYEATQRSDPRGSISQIPDRHEHQFQLFHGTGKWWSPSSMVAVKLGDLPPTFREALSKRKGDTLVIGYPLAMMDKDGARGVFPVGLICASVSRTGFVLEITPHSDVVVLNPDWIQLAIGGTAWSVKALTEQFDTPEGLAFDEFRERLSDCMATQISSPLVPDSLVASIDPRVTGICNAAAIFLPTQTSFTKGTAADLGQLARMPAQQLKGTALWNLLHDNGTERTAGIVLNPVPLTPNQFEATELAITGAVTAITGPPGTGKIQVIVSVIASALAENKTVLFASRNYQATDALERRLAELSPEQPIIVRTNDREGDQDTDFVRVIADLAGNDTRPIAELIEDSLHGLRSKAAARARIVRDRTVAQRLNCILSEHIERRAEILAHVEKRPPQSNSLFSGQLHFLRLRRAAPVAEILAPGATLDELDAAIERDQKALARIAAEDPTSLNEEIVAGMKALFPALMADALAVNTEDHQKLYADQKELELSGLIKAHELTEHIARQVLACRPMWAATTLSVPTRVPLVPGLFDYVICDDANQCDIATALPLMARAKQAVVIGDPNQLQSIPGLGLAQERTLMKSAGLPLRGRGQYAQSRNSLFDFCAGRPKTRSVMLRDQFCSAPEIVDYLNDAFYDGQLRAARDVTGLKVPAAAKPGISWTDVRGRVSLDHTGQPQNHDEAKAIAAHLQLLLCEQDYEGSIGVIAPFNAQVALIRRLIDDDIPQERQERAQLKIAAADRFQGEMRDIILFSPVAGPGLGQGAHALLKGDKQRINLAISRARAIAHVFGNLSFAQESGIRHLAKLAESTAHRRDGQSPEDVFDSIWERRVDAALSARGIKATPQYPIAGRYLDFALFGKGEVKLNLEVDGRRSYMDPDGRRKIDDIWRDRQLRNLGWRIRRFWVHELEQNMEGCLDQVERDLAG